MRNNYNFKYQNVTEKNEKTREELEFNMQRENLYLIKEMIKGKNINSVLDIGCKDKFLKKLILPKKYIGIDINKEADIILDLNKKIKLPFKDKSFDLVVASQILEHLFRPLKLVKEIKRISKKYILIGLPNEYTYDNRIRFLFGKEIGFNKGYNEFGHHHLFDIDTIQKFIKENFKDLKIIDKRYLFRCKGGRFIPLKIRNLLAKLYPKLFAKEVYYLLRFF